MDLKQSFRALALLATRKFDSDRRRGAAEGHIRSTRTKLLISAAAAISIFAAVPALASARAFTYFDPIRADGYRVSLSDHDAQAQLSIQKHLDRLHGVSYVGYDGSSGGTQEHVVAMFGRFGAVNMRFHKTGKFKPMNLPAHCTGTPTKTAKGVWKGNVDFKSEQGLVKLHRKSWPGQLFRPGNLTCVYPSEHYVYLAGDSRQDDTSFEAARVTGSHPKTTIFANVSERKQGTAIARGIAIKGKSGDFVYKSDLTKAAARSTGPFAGKAKYTSTTSPSPNETTGSIGGNLKVTFLGENTAVPFKFRKAYVRRTTTNQRTTADGPGALRP